MSKFQPWNSVNVGPHKDIVGTWAKLAHDAGMPFGVSVHSARAWSWYEDAQGADTNGPLAGVPYDGKLTKADGLFDLTKHMRRDVFTHGLSVDQ